MIDSFVAFDFETSNGKNPCSIGIAEFKDGKLIDEYYSLIKPKDLYFNPYAQAVHGIQVEEVLNEREFPEVWKDIAHFFINKKVVAHNYQFDMGVLNHCFKLYSLPKIDFNIDCTLKLSRRYLDLPNYKLSSVASHFNIKQDNYHNAMEDALVCGKIYYQLYVGNYVPLKRGKQKSIQHKNQMNLFH